MSKTECPVTVAGLTSEEDLAPWRQVSSNPNVPFIHRFQTARHRYLYDVNTARILRVAPVVWDIAADVGATAEEEMIARYADRYAAREISAAFAAVRTMQKEKGLLLAHRPAHITMPYGDAELQEQLRTQRRILVLGVTEACNFRCRYCVFSGTYRTRRMHTSRMMTWDVARPALDEFLTRCIRRTHIAHGPTVSFYGGEPLLNVALIRKCVAYARTRRPDLDFVFSMNTNGSLLEGDAADFLASERFALMVSLDGPQPVHDRNRHLADGTATWERVVANIKAFLKRHPEYRTSGLMGVAAVVTPPADMLQLDAFFSTCDFLTDDINVRLGWVFGNDSTYIDDLAPEDRRVEGLTTLYERYVSNLESGRINENHQAVPFKLQAAIFERTFLQLHQRGVSTSKFPLIPDHFCALPACIPGAHRLFVTVDGTYYTCDRSPDVDFLKIGNIHEGIDVAKVKRILDDFVTLGKEECRFCWCLPTCNAGCMLTVMENGRLSSKARQTACAAHRQITDRTLRNMCRVLEQNPHALDYLDKIILS